MCSLSALAFKTTGKEIRASPSSKLRRKREMLPSQLLYAKTLRSANGKSGGNLRPVQHELEEHSEKRREVSFR